MDESVAEPESLSEALLDWLLVVLVLLAVQDLDAALLGPWAPRQAGEETAQEGIWQVRSKPACVFVVLLFALPPVGGVVSSDVSGAIAAGGGTPEGQTPPLTVSFHHS